MIKVHAGKMARKIAVLMLSFGCTQIAPAQTETPKTATAEPVDLEVFKGPSKKHVEPPAYPQEEIQSGRDGWVNLNFMIDPQGTPYEIVVQDSTGNKELEKAAIRAAKKWTFEPATLNGTPIDAGYTMKVAFVLHGASGANSAFVKLYRKFMTAAKAGDKAGAEAAMHAMKVKNLYEDAYFGLVEYEFARQWGTQSEQLAGICRAIAEERNATYLSKSTFASGLETLLTLQIQTRDFAGALKSWDKLSKTADPDVLARWEKPISRIHALHSAASSYGVAGEFGDSTSWHIQLFRNKFQIVQSTGRIAEIKLRCDKRFVFFKYEPEILYTISQKYGSCNLELVGDPGTKFQLVQS